MLAVRGAVTRAVEPWRKNGDIGHSLETCVSLFVSPALKATLAAARTDLRALCIVSQLLLDDLDKAPVEAQASDLAGLKILVGKARGEKCARCWIYSTELGTDAAHPTLCPRCAAVVRG